MRSDELSPRERKYLAAFVDLEAARHDRVEPSGRDRGWARLQDAIAVEAFVEDELPAMQPPRRNAVVWVGLAVAATIAAALMLSLAGTTADEQRPSNVFEQSTADREAPPSFDASLERDAKRQPSRVRVPADPSKPASVEPAIVVVPEAPRAEPPPRSRRRSAPPPRAEADLDPAEVELLRRARAAIARGDRAVGLTVLEEHRRRFPLGVLAPERETRRLSLLCELGRDDASARASFEASRPADYLRAQVERACESRSDQTVSASERH